MVCPDSRSMIVRPTRSLESLGMLLTPISILENVKPTEKLIV